MWGGDMWARWGVLIHAALVGLCTVRSALAIVEKMRSLCGSCNLVYLV